MSTGPGLSIPILDAAYKKYGFQVVDPDDVNARVYILQAGHFINAEVVPLADSAAVQRKIDELKDAGYAVRRQDYRRAADAHQKLFNAYFRLLPSRNRASRLYSDFQGSLSKYLGSRYQYVTAPHEVLFATSPCTKDNVIEAIVAAFASDGPQLIFLEAAAGFGKTCTAFEVLSRLLSLRDDWIPILSELSRDRTARIFRHVLLEEIDRTFNLPSALVTEEIQHGRIPLILDGFDELLSHNPVDNDAEATFDDAASMLETIASLLINRAKILVTTRSTALFAGKDFDDWIARQEATGCGVTRLLLAKPTLGDWVSKKVRKRLEKSLPIEQLANPVLLSFLRQQPDERIDNLCSAPDTIVDFYFESLLTRESQRQDLRMSPTDQLRILRNLAREMLEQDFTCETRDVVRLCIASCPESEELLSKSLEQYGPTDAVTLDILVDKFLVHALLDRLPTRNLIGFVNDFVLGTLQGEVVCEIGQEWAGTVSQVDRITTAYAVKSKAARVQLWDALATVRVAGDVHQRVLAGLRLMQRIEGAFDSAVFENYEFARIRIGGGNSFAQCQFIRCTFDRCDFSPEHLLSCGFIDCRFFNCRTSGNPTGDCYASGCTASSKNFLPDLLASHPPETHENERDYRKVVLEQFWPPGRPNFTKRKKTSTLLLGSPPADRRLVVAAINDLAMNRLITPARDPSYFLNTEALPAIMSILGRAGNTESE